MGFADTQSLILSEKGRKWRFGFSKNPTIKNTSKWVVNAVRIPLLSLDERLERHAILSRQKELGVKVGLEASDDVEMLRDAILGLQDRATIFSLLHGEVLHGEVPHKVHHDQEYKYIFYTTQHVPRFGTAVRIWFMQVLSNRSPNILIEETPESQHNVPAFGSLQVKDSADIVGVILATAFGDKGLRRTEVLTQLGVTDFCGMNQREKDQEKKPLIDLDY